MCQIGLGLENEQRARGSTSRRGGLNIQTFTLGPTPNTANSIASRSILAEYIMEMNGAILISDGFLARILSSIISKTVIGIMMKGLTCMVRIYINGAPESERNLRAMLAIGRYENLERLLALFRLSQRGIGR